MSASSLVIGIDTGGTYTDAVLVRPRDGEILATAKTPTTPHDPARAIDRCLRSVFTTAGLPPERIALVTVSTTLATNAIVEDKGADVGLFVIGHDRRLSVPAADVRFIPGGHKAKGVESEPLGMEFLLQGIAEMRPHVDAYAICAMLAFDDPTHELVAAKALELMDPKPVFCSHQASTRPGMVERATTAVLNARLLPVMREFLRSIDESMRALGLSCPVRILRGDGHAMNLEHALRNASTTVASGPAATALFGSHAAKGGTSLIVDVGGTTTDITLLRDGQPVIREDGMTIGSWKTHVRAVEMYTVGIGGDSLARVEHGALHLGPSRVIPLCQARLHVREEFLDVPLHPETWLGENLRAQCLIPVAARPTSDDRLLNWLGRHGPATPHTLRSTLDIAEGRLEKSIARLAAKNLLLPCGFTPTDALHVLGRLHLGDPEPARNGAERLASLLNLSPEEFCRRVLRLAHETIARTILSALGTQVAGPVLADFLTRRDPDPLLEISVRVRPPMIGIGAAAPYILPGVAELLGTSVCFPPHHDVGNALGAALLAEPEVTK